MPRRLPGELTDRIIDYLHDQPDGLFGCSLVCTAWLHTCRFHLWSDFLVHPGIAQLIDKPLSSHNHPIFQYARRIIIYLKVYLDYPDEVRGWLLGVFAALPKFQALRSIAYVEEDNTRALFHGHEMFGPTPLPQITCLELEGMFFKSPSNFLDCIAFRLPALEQLRIETIEFLENPSEEDDPMFPEHLWELALDSTALVMLDIVSFSSPAPTLRSIVLTSLTTYFQDDVDLISKALRMIGSSLYALEIPFSCPQPHSGRSLSIMHHGPAF